jgi:thiamine-monophosphate kinase
VPRESEFIASLRGLAGRPAARNLLDDAAVIEFGGKQLVLTHDMLIEGVHFLPSDRPEDVAWKLVAVNLSDLAAKGACPMGVLLGYSLTAEDAWNSGFVQGLGEALGCFGTTLLGGDTVAAPPGSPRAFGLTAIGTSTGNVPSRTGAKAGDILWVSGTIGDAGAGLRIARGEIGGAPALAARYRRPQPRLEAGRALAPIVTAMMDVSDGLLIDAARMASASALALQIELRDVPLSPDLVAALGDTRQALLDAATAGDDYELLFAASPDRSNQIRALAASLPLPLTPVGRFGPGNALTLADGGEPIPLPASLGFEHAPPESPPAVPKG